MHSSFEEAYLRTGFCLSTSRTPSASMPARSSSATCSPSSGRSSKSHRQISRRWAHPRRPRASRPRRTTARARATAGAPRSPRTARRRAPLARKAAIAGQRHRRDHTRQPEPQRRPRRGRRLWPRSRSGGSNWARASPKPSRTQELSVNRSGESSRSRRRARRMQRETLPEDFEEVQQTRSRVRQGRARLALAVSKADPRITRPMHPTQVGGLGTLPT